MHPKDADGMANSVDPDQTASSWSALFAETYLSQYIEFVRYLVSLTPARLLAVSVIREMPSSDAVRNFALDFQHISERDFCQIKQRSHKTIGSGITVVDAIGSMVPTNPPLISR